MAVIGERLFCQRPLDDALRQAGDRLHNAVERIQAEDFAQHSDEELVSCVVAGATMMPLEVVSDQTFAVQPIKVDVTDHPKYGFGPGPVWAEGYRVTRTLSFTGDRELWRLKPRSGISPPPRGTIEDQTLVIGIEVPKREKGWASKYIQEVTAMVRKYLHYQAAQIQQHNDHLPAQALALVQQQRERLRTAADFRKELAEQE
jgi:hypothetical protein